MNQLRELAVDDHADVPVILIVGSLRAWAEAGQDLPQLDRTYYADFKDLDPPLLDCLRPDIVISHLIGTGFDAMDVAARLSQLGFTGAFRAISLPLPRPDLVRREVAALAPGLDFDVLVLSD